MFRRLCSKITWNDLHKVSIESVIVYPKFSSLEKDNPLLGSREFGSVKALNSVIGELELNEFLRIKSADNLYYLNSLIKNLIKYPGFKKMAYIQINKSSKNIIRFIRKDYKPKAEDRIAFIELNSYRTELSIRTSNRLNIILHSLELIVSTSILSVLLVMILN